MIWFLALVCDISVWGGGGALLFFLVGGGGGGVCDLVQGTCNVTTQAITNAMASDSKCYGLRVLACVYGKGYLK